MSSFVYYKFKSQREPQRITIDGPHTDVWNLKREIINHARLGDGTDFDLRIYRENSNEEYTDDTEVIPKDSTVLARRLPAATPGRGRAARYVSGKPPVSAKPSFTATRAGKSVNMDSAMTEEERFKAMLQLTDAQWQQKQEEMSHETRVPMQGGKPFPKKVSVPEGEPPHGYICYRCGKKGHWIQACPTNDDANYDNKNRIKRTTGIPRSMLKKIDQSEIENLDDAQRQNLMVNADGEYVFAQADEKAWRRHQEQVKAAKAAQKDATSGNQELQRRGLECPIDKRLFVDPMKTPCCGKTYCHDCIENALLENDLTCPGCETENISLERLEPDEDKKAKIKDYEEGKDDSNTPDQGLETPVKAESPAEHALISREGSPASTGGQPKKRSASEAASAGSPAAPAMKKQKSTQADESQDTENASVSANESNSKTLENMMPPDMSAMMQSMASNFPAMPFMPGMMPNGMMGMNGMMMPGMNFMQPNFGMMNGMFNPIQMGNFNMGMNGGLDNQFGNNGFSQNHNRQGNRNQQTYQQPTGMAGVPTGPRTLQNQGPPTGPANKFSNQQRQSGNDEDNPYQRQPVNPHRAYNKGRNKMRQADYREL